MGLEGFALSVNRALINEMYSVPSIALGSITLLNNLQSKAVIALDAG